MEKEFLYDYKKFISRIFLKNVLLILLNISILVWTFLNVDPEKKNSFFGLGALFLFLLGFFLYQAFLKQKKLFESTKLVLNGNILQQYGFQGECNSINLKRISKIEKDSYRGFIRYQIFELEEIISILNIKEDKLFEEQLKKISGKTIDEFFISKKELLKRIASYFAPALVSFSLFYFNFILIQYFYLVLSVNALFFTIQFSEKRTRGGFSESSVRRICLILFIFICYQIFSIFYKI